MINEFTQMFDFIEIIIRTTLKDNYMPSNGEIKSLNLREEIIKGTLNQVGKKRLIHLDHLDQTQNLPPNI